MMMNKRIAFFFYCSLFSLYASAQASGGQITRKKTSIISTNSHIRSSSNRESGGSSKKDATVRRTNRKASKLKQPAISVSREEKTLVSTIFHNFFEAINKKDAVALKNSVAEKMTLLNKENATKGDVVDMMNKLYKEDVVKMIWRLQDNYDIKKRKISNNMYEYNLSFFAYENLEFIESSKNNTNKFKVNATINPDGKISLFKMIKIVE